MDELFLLKDPLIVEVKGRDAKRYLNARLTNNIRDLGVGKSCVAGMLNPQGRTEGLFTVLHNRDNEFLVYCDDGDHQKILAALKRYIVADRVTIEEKSPTWGVLHSYSDITANDLIAINKRRSITPGKDFIGDKGALERISGDRISFDTYTIKRIRAGILSFPEELNENTNFAEGELEEAISFTKGCYVGQEVIEKVNAFGKVPRKIISVIVKGKNYKQSQGEKVLTSVYDSTTDETLMFISALRE